MTVSASVIFYVFPGKTNRIEGMRKMMVEMNLFIKDVYHIPPFNIANYFNIVIIK